LELLHGGDIVFKAYDGKRLVGLATIEEGLYKDSSGLVDSEIDMLDFSTSSKIGSMKVLL
jgi:hypothetical protein